MEAVILEIVVTVLINGLEVWDGDGVFEIEIPSDSFFYRDTRKLYLKDLNCTSKCPVNSDSETCCNRCQDGNRLAYWHIDTTDLSTCFQLVFFNAPAKCVLSQSGHVQERLEPYIGPSICFLKESPRVRRKGTVTLPHSCQRYRSQKAGIVAALIRTLTGTIKEQILCLPGICNWSRKIIFSVLKCWVLRVCRGVTPRQDSACVLFLPR
jgi:hypothetical protein